MRDIFIGIKLWRSALLKDTFRLFDDVALTTRVVSKTVAAIHRKSELSFMAPESEVAKPCKIRKWSTIGK
jgi:hypothetical protein